MGCSTAGEALIAVFENNSFGHLWYLYMIIGIYLSYLKKLFEYSNGCSIVTCNRQMVKNGKPGHKFNYGDSEPIVLKKAEVYRRGLYTQLAHGAVARLYKKEVFSNLRFPLGIDHEDTYMSRTIKGN